jgi:hypothetical protein
MNLLRVVIGALFTKSGLYTQNPFSAHSEYNRGSTVSGGFAQNPVGVFLYASFRDLFGSLRTSLGVRQLRCGTRMSVPRRRLDDRLREICAKLRTASADELEDTLQELLALVHRKAERLKARAGRLLLQGEQLEPERRKSMM